MIQAPKIIVALFLFVAALASVQPTITALSNTTAACSSRLLVQGSGFGASQSSGRVEIGGIIAPLTGWADTLIAAYVPEAAATGSANVRVFAAGGSSNAVPLNVTPRSGQSERIRWRFQADGDYIPTRPAIATDGTVYTQDVYGHLYAVGPDGGLKWIFNAPGTGHCDISIGQDGMIYIGNTSSIFALAPNGTLRWKFDQNPGAYDLCFVRGG